MRRYEDASLASDGGALSGRALTWLGKGDGGTAEGTLSVAALEAGYGRSEVVFGVTLHVDPGECVALLGANGAGKTTLLRAISGIVAVRSGTVTLGRRLLSNLAAERIVRAGVAHVPQGRALFATMSVEDNIRVGGYTLKPELVEPRVAEVLGLFPQMNARRRQPAGQLSGGEQQMVAMMRGLMIAPQVLLLDEPTLGLSPAARIDVLRVVGQARDAGVAVLLVEQNARKALAVSDRCCVMRSGRIVYEATGDDALASYEDVANQYLGVGEE